ncbi:MAG: hypothetical protein KF813_06375 [Trueperaceae bacterium]|nr:hypothetical protein [Trueperaceae bacterium]
MRLAAWRLALACFVLAALTGALFRFSAYFGTPYGLLLGNIRHAHSHLMFFAWATPVLMLLADEALRRRGRRLPGSAGVAIAAVVCGLLAFTPFLLSGYGMLPVGDRLLPLSMMASGVNGLVWYAFAVLYLVGSWRLTRDLPLRLLDGATVLLLVSSVGAVLLAKEGASHTLTPITMAAYVDLFLTSFADGWFGIGVLAGLALALAARVERFGWVAWTLAAALSARAFTRLFQDAYGVAGLGFLESGAGFVAAVAWLLLVWRMWPHGSGVERGTLLLIRATLALMALKAVVELVLATPAGEQWVDQQGLRVFLLHAFLLGAVTFGLVAAAREVFGRRAFPFPRWLVASVVVMVFLLLPQTRLWPAALAGFWMLPAAAWSSLGPPVVAGVALVLSLKRRRVQDLG